MKKIKVLAFCMAVFMVLSGCSAIMQVYAERKEALAGSSDAPDSAADPGTQTGPDAAEGEGGGLSIPPADTNSDPGSAPSNVHPEEPAPTEQAAGAITMPRSTDVLELPIIGATGIATVEMQIRENTSANSAIVATVPSGTAFRILAEDGAWWEVQNDTVRGWVQHRFCMVNLPDVIPSIIYNNANTYQSRFVSSGKSIPNITGQALYNGRSFNPRLNREEYIVPVLYAMSKKIAVAQRSALAQNDTLVIYEGYRPSSVQQKVVNELTAFSQADPEVLAGINSYPWSMDWFIAVGVSNHQMGYAIDVTLAKVVEKEVRQNSKYSYDAILKYTEYQMPTVIHELSAAAATFAQPVTSSSDTEWRSAAFAESMNEAAKVMQKYCTDAGLSPLASEWWHFNDLAAMNEIQVNPSTGDFDLPEILSVD